MQRSASAQSHNNLREFLEQGRTNHVSVASTRHFNLSYTPQRCRPLEPRLAIQYSPLYHTMGHLPTRSGSTIKFPTPATSLIDSSSPQVDGAATSTTQKKERDGRTMKQKVPVCPCRPFSLHHRWLKSHT
jgi:hypothetical protein